MRVLSPAVAAAMAAVLCAGAVGEEKGAGASRVVLQGVDQYRVTEPMFESVRVVLGYRGETYTPAYIQGISGQAFRIAGPCPCAPTCENAMQVQDLVQMLGYKFEWAPMFGDGVDPKERYPQVLARVKDEIRANRPVIVWSAFTTAEWDVVCGFDDGKKEFYGRGSYRSMQQPEYTHADWMRAGTPSDVAPLIGVIFVGDKEGTFDPKAAELGALREAVAHAYKVAIKGSLRVGLDCYDSWIASYRNRGALVRAKSRDGKDLGFVLRQTDNDSYPLEILPSTRQAAADFSRELAAKYPAAKGYLEMAADDFALESAALEACRTTLADRSTEPSDEQCAQAAGDLSRARAMYALAIGEIERALPIMAKAE